MVEAANKISDASISASEIKIQLRNILQKIQELRQLANLALSLNDKDAIQDKKEMVDKCEQIKLDLEEDAKIVCNASQKTQAVNKILKMERKKRWRLRKRRIDRVKGAVIRSMISQRNAKIDQWKKEKEEQIETEIEEAKHQELIYDKEIRIKELLKKKYEIQKLLISVNSLYQLRLAKLRKQGYKVDAGKSEENEMKAIQAEIDTYKEKEVQRKMKAEWTMKEEIKEETDDEFYFGSQYSIHKLIAVRRAWDTYLVPIGHGSRIPTHFVRPPTREWI